MTVLEHIKQLSHSLTPQQRRELEKYLKNGEKLPKPKPRQSLRDTWKIDVPDDFDLDAALREIRDEWKKELDEFYL